MTDKERIERLERLVAKMASALYRMDTEKDGNWGHPPCRQELHEIIGELPSK